MARHHADAMVAPDIREAIANLVERGRDVAAILRETWIERIRRCSRFHGAP
jgi:hypothetical protein